MKTDADRRARVVWMEEEEADAIAREAYGGRVEAPYLLLPVTFEDGEPVIHGGELDGYVRRLAKGTDRRERDEFTDTLFTLAREAKPEEEGE